MAVSVVVSVAVDAALPTLNFIPEPLETEVEVDLPVGAPSVGRP